MRLPIVTIAALALWTVTELEARAQGCTGGGYAAPGAYSAPQFAPQFSMPPQTFAAPQGYGCNGGGYSLPSGAGGYSMPPGAGGYSLPGYGGNGYGGYGFAPPVYSPPSFAPQVGTAQFQREDRTVYRGLIFPRPAVTESRQFHSYPSFPLSRPANPWLPVYDPGYFPPVGLGPALAPAYAPAYAPVGRVTGVLRGVLRGVHRGPQRSGGGALRGLA